MSFERLVFSITLLILLLAWGLSFLTWYANELLSLQKIYLTRWWPKSTEPNSVVFFFFRLRFATRAASSFTRTEQERTRKSRREYLQDGWRRQLSGIKNFLSEGGPCGTICNNCTDSTTALDEAKGKQRSKSMTYSCILWQLILHDNSANHVWVSEKKRKF